MVENLELKSRFQHRGSVEPQTQRALERFAAEMSDFDTTVLVLLKGHLLIEEALTGILALHVFHPEHLETARLSFHHKLCIVRALGLRKAQHGEWELIQKINGLRNELAHQLQSPDRDKKVGQLRDIYRREAAGLEDVEVSADDQEAVLISSACALVLGFLSAMHADSDRDFGHCGWRRIRSIEPAVLRWRRLDGEAKSPVFAT